MTTRESIKNKEMFSLRPNMFCLMSQDASTYTFFVPMNKEEVIELFLSLTILQKEGYAKAQNN